MEGTFDSKEFIKKLGNELVHEFEKASMGTTPVCVGSARENSIRKKIESVLPIGIGVGSGFIIDSYGRTSRQCDIIIYEKNYAMQIKINDDNPNTYYNCECVIAAGEVKSDVTIAEIEDAFKKIKSVRELRRRDDGENSYRLYNSPSVFCTINSDKYNQDEKAFDQIFTFLFCKSLKVKHIAIFEKAEEILIDDCNYYNAIFSTEGDVLAYHKNKTIGLSALWSNQPVFLKTAESFNLLICFIYNYISQGRTTGINNAPYILDQSIHYDIMEAYEVKNEIKDV